jgi:hypothetical protein
VRLRLILPRRRGGAGLGGLSARASCLASALLLAGVSLAGLLACGSARRPGASEGAAGFGRPAFGLSENDAALLWRPGSAAAAPGRTTPAAGAWVAGRVQLAREELSALKPRYVRLLIDWAALQPRADRPPELEAAVAGCARTIAPCAPYAGVREELAAIASQQRARGRPGGGFQVVLDIFGTPAWAARGPAGCERGAHGAFSRRPSAVGIAGYRALIHSLITLAADEGVALDWWTPWNEPNDPTFLSPQRASCDGAGAALSVSAYAELARAMLAQLRSEGGTRHLLLGELNAYDSGSPERTSVAEFVRALPADVACAADAWSIHAYAARGASAPARDPVQVLEAALDARGGCAAGARVWVTEAGAGAPHPGDARPAGAADERAGCVALAGQLLRWFRDPRVSVVLQYTFREDPAFPVGLSTPELGRTYPAYELWLAWARSSAVGEQPPGAPACG